MTKNQFSLTAENTFFPNKISNKTTEINPFVAAFWNYITFANNETLSQTKWLPLDKIP